MTLQQRQSHLIQQINKVSDENVLILIDEELSYHLKNKDSIELNDFDLSELIMLAEEPDDKDTISEDEYRKATGKWRM